MSPYNTVCLCAPLALILICCVAMRGYQNQQYLYIGLENSTFLY